MAVEEDDEEARPADIEALGQVEEDLAVAVSLVLPVDAPGAGASSDPPETFGMDGYADCLAAFMTAAFAPGFRRRGFGFGYPVVAGVGLGLAASAYYSDPCLVLDPYYVWVNVCPYSPYYY